SDRLGRRFARGADHERDFVVFPQPGGQPLSSLRIHFIVVNDDLEPSIENGHGARGGVLEPELEPSDRLRTVDVERPGEGLNEADLDRDVTGSRGVDCDEPEYRNYG